MESTIEIKLLETDEGKVPFEEWYDSLRGKVTRVRVRRRLDRIELGNFGDTQSVGSGVYELRLYFGVGYRVYFARVGNTIIVLVGGVFMVFTYSGRRKEGIHVKSAKL